MNKKSFEGGPGKILLALPESTPPLVKPLSDRAALLDRLVLTLALAPPRALAKRKKKQPVGPATRSE